MCFFFFKQKTAYEMRISDWSSDVCSSDLSAWRGRARRVFVNEYIYQSFVPGVSGRLIYEITSSKILSFIGRQVSRVLPSLRANTFGIGVRFRSHKEWRQLFAEAGFHVLDMRTGRNERSEERRVGKEWFSTCRSRGLPDHE